MGWHYYITKNRKLIFIQVVLNIRNKNITKQRVVKTGMNLTTVVVTKKKLHPLGYFFLFFP